MKNLTIGLSALALSIAGTAYARPNPDTNNDGVVTRSEAKAHSQRTFATLDANKDGSLTKADRDMRKKQRRNKIFDAMDANKDGYISRNEFNSAKSGKRQHGSGKTRARRADTNKDGAITKTEFTSAALARFDRMDKNSDKQLSKAERQAMRQKMPAR